MKRLGFILGTLMALATIAGAQSWTFTDVSAIITGYQPTCAGSLAWGDMDNDGDMDLFVGGTDGNSSYLYSNMNGELIDVSELYGLRNYSTEYVHKADWVDYDGDGRMDLSLVKENNWGVQLDAATRRHVHLAPSDHEPGVRAAGDGSHLGRHRR